jgi:uncharacterized protein YeeX (DUF496 family)
MVSLFRSNQKLRVEDKPKSTRDNHARSPLLTSVANNIVDPIKVVLETEALRDELGSTVRAAPVAAARAGKETAVL